MSAQPIVPTQQSSTAGISHRSETEQPRGNHNKNSSSSLNYTAIMPPLTHIVNQQDQASTSIADNDDGKVIARTLAALNTLATDYECPICLDALTDTRINPECRHRFCGDCIKESMGRCNNECPSCRVHIPTKRTLRRINKICRIQTWGYPTRI